MLPHLALGASQGVEDANLLAKLLANSRVTTDHIPVSATILPEIVMSRSHTCAS